MKKDGHMSVVQGGAGMAAIGGNLHRKPGGVVAHAAMQGRGRGCATAAGTLPAVWCRCKRVEELVNTCIVCVTMP